MNLLKRRKLLEFALGALWRRKGRNGALAAVFVLVVSMLFSVLLIVDSLKTEAVNLLLHSPDVVVQRVWAGRHDLVSASYAERIAREPGVASAVPRLWGYYYDAFTESNFTIMHPLETEEPTRQLEGRLPAASDECALGLGVARLRKAALGDELSLIDANAVGQTFKVVGIFREDSQLLTNDLILFTREAVAAFFAFPEGMATDIAVRLHNPVEANALAKKTVRIFPDTRPITLSEMRRTYDAVFNWRSGMLLAALLGAVLAFVVMAWDKATGLSAEEKREIGILKAIGWDTSDILEMKFWEGFSISAFSLFVGFGLSLLHVFHLESFLLGPILRGWSVLFPPLDVTPDPDYLAVAQVAFIVCVPYIAATVIPSWKAAKADPDEAIRG